MFYSVPPLRETNECSAISVSYRQCQLAPFHVAKSVLTSIQVRYYALIAVAIVAFGECHIPPVEVLITDLTAFMEATFLPQ